MRDKQSLQPGRSHLDCSFPRSRVPPDITLKALCREPFGHPAPWHAPLLRIDLWVHAGTHLSPVIHMTQISAFRQDPVSPFVVGTKINQISIIKTQSHYCKRQRKGQGRRQALVERLESETLPKGVLSSKATCHMLTYRCSMRVLSISQMWIKLSTFTAQAVVHSFIHQRFTWSISMASLLCSRSCTRY